MYCLQRVVSNHSDTEMGRCVSSMARVGCQPLREFTFKQMYYQQVETISVRIHMPQYTKR